MAEKKTTKKTTKKVAPIIKKESESQKIRKMDEATIENEIVELKKELFNLRFQAAVGKLENTARIRTVRKQIARMKTILTEMDMKKKAE